MMQQQTQHRSRIPQWLLLSLSAWVCLLYVEPVNSSGLADASKALQQDPVQSHLTWAEEEPDTDDINVSFNTDPPCFDSFWQISVAQTSHQQHDIPGYQPRAPPPQRHR
ncbi:hypothetical protein [Lacimicrobium alkaliphilum]|uniref:Uncharacterized protein n=1 Tax=Lacimicrobium alkaliphilum TaxID=1526571 RepID=A0A0U3AYX6_9ALTE|nr:hypothetical protein [Lacimicrobium alkaliphilum]ALS98096.1 hypothetical protein AT746_07335 [Lacimicrobium alkaliphilum]